MRCIAKPMTCCAVLAELMFELPPQSIPTGPGVGDSVREDVLTAAKMGPTRSHVRD